MPIRDGIETIRHLKGTFSGKVIMISQVESKELIAEAYSPPKVYKSNIWNCKKIKLYMQLKLE